MLKTDQLDRLSTILSGWRRKDKIRRERVLYFYDKGLIVTSKAMYNAASLLVHGDDSTHFKLSHQLVSVAIDSGYPKAKWLQEASYDRWMESIGKKVDKVKVNYGNE